ncbi:ACT domain-containing protein [Streptobacillus moniliformis]|uniref:ACT domain-containing protein n=1 Tax=Streptobacillus moniliformis TaxID=34105 RepID=UPI0007E49DF7|nr:ACT domain-containing protein [Streptobacillus moniliformis]
MKKTIITVVGLDKIGIIAKICNSLAEVDINILDISQSILEGYFNMIMIVDVTKSSIEHIKLQERLDLIGKELDIQIKAQKEEIFQSMHRV